MSRKPRVAILNPETGGYVPINAPIRKLPRILKTLDQLEWLRRNDPKRHRQALRLLAKFSKENKAVVARRRRAA
jgi:hypothetical protein